MVCLQKGVKIFCNCFNNLTAELGKPKSWPCLCASSELELCLWEHCRKTKATHRGVKVVGQGCTVPGTARAENTTYFPSDLGNFAFLQGIADSSMRLDHQALIIRAQCC